MSRSMKFSCELSVGLCKVKRAYLSEESLSRVKAWSKQQAHSGVQVNRPDVVHPIETQHTAKLPFHQIQRHYRPDHSGTKRCNMSAHANRKRTTSGGSGYGKDQKREPRQRPNFFIALQIPNKQIHLHAHTVQSSMITTEPRLAPCAVSISKLHITLTVLHLEDQMAIDKAKEVLNDVVTKRLTEQNIQSLRVNLEGLSTFNNKVLYADIPESDDLQKIYKVAGIVSEEFKRHGLPPTDNKFTAHVTLFKLSAQKRWVLRRIEPEWYDKHRDIKLGEDVVDYLQLCEMDVPTDDGYYKVHHQCKFTDTGAESREGPEVT